MAGVDIWTGAGYHHLGNLQNTRTMISQGYDPGEYSVNQGATWNGSGDGAYANNDGLQFTLNDQGIYDGSDGYKYDQMPNYASGDNWDGNYKYRRRNDALSDWKDRPIWDQNIGGNNWEWADHPDWLGQMDAKIKSGEKVATNVRYNFNGQEWVPTITGREGWDTNADNRTRNLAFAAMLTAGIGGALAAPAAASTGMVEAGALAGASEAAIGTGGLWNGALGVTAGTGTAGTGIGVGGMGVGGSSWMDTIKQGYDYYNQGKKIYNGFNTISDMIGGGNQQAGGARPRQGGTGGLGGSTGGSGMGWLDQIMGIGSGLYSEHQNRESGRHLEDIYNRREQERQPFVDRLNASYADNGRSYLEGEYKPLADIEGNRLARLGAQRGTNANDVDRERLLQAHAAKNLESHREGLRGALKAHDLTGHQKLIEEAMRRNANEGGATMGGIGYRGGAAGGGGGLAGIIGGARDAYGSISDWFGGGGSASNNYGGGYVGEAMDSWDESLMGAGGGYVSNPDNWESLLGDNVDWYSEDAYGAIGGFFA
jgi:hypothetical protein